MTVQELLDKLTELEDKSLPVVLFTDHGQTPMKLDNASVDAVEDINEHMMEFASYRSVEEGTGTVVFVLEAG